MNHMCYRLYISLEPLRDEMWRVIDVPTNMPLDELGFMIISSFQYGEITDFDIEYNDKVYASKWQYEDAPETYFLASEYTLEDLNMEMFDDLGFGYSNCTDDFLNIKLIDIRPMEQGIAYPHVAYGKGQSVINGLDAHELQSKIDKIVNCGGDPIVFNSEDGTPHIWDYYSYDIDEDNEKLIFAIKDFKEMYESYNPNEDTDEDE